MEPAQRKESQDIALAHANNQYGFFNADSGVNLLYFCNREFRVNEAWAYDIKREGSSKENAGRIQKRVQETGRNVLIRT